MSLGTNLANLRKKKGISQEQLALEIGVSRQAISKWETDTSQPELSNIKKICEVLEITPNELMGYTNERINTQSKESFFKNKYFILSIFILTGIFLLFLITNRKEKHYGFYINDFQMEVIKEDADTKTYSLSFVPSMINTDFNYSILVEYEDGKKEIYDAYLNNSLCLSEITLSVHDDAIVYAQIKVENLVFMSPLVNILASRGAGE